MDRLKAMANFVRINDSGSLSAAADSSGQSVASLVRSLAALEQHLGVRLLNRSTRRMALTEEGAQYLAWSRRMLAEVELMEQHFDNARHDRPAGLLRLTAPVEFGQRYIAPLVNDFLKAHREMRVELMLDDRINDLLDEGLDLAVRIGRLPDSSMVARTVGHTRLITCASPDYLRGAPTPDSPRALHEHICINQKDRGRHWYFRSGKTELVEEVQARLVTNQTHAVRLACVQGLGIARLLHYQVWQELQDGRLQRILQAFEPEALPVQLVFPHAQMLAPRVRAFIDWTCPRLEAQLPDPG